MLKDTVNVQKQMMGEMNADNVYDLMDQMREVKEDQDEINDAFTRNYDVEVEDEELDAELDELDHEMRVELDGRELTVPNKRIMSKKEMDEKELEDVMK